MMTDPLGDTLTRIRNGLAARKAVVRCLHSSFIGRVLDVLTREGYIRTVREVEIRKNIKAFDVELKYHENLPAIVEIARVSKPGRAVYTSLATMPRFYNGLGTLVLSTSKGVMSDRDARQARLGGEILCRVF